MNKLGCGILLVFCKKVISKINFESSLDLCSLFLIHIIYIFT